MKHEKIVPVVEYARCSDGKQGEEEVKEERSERSEKGFGVRARVKRRDSIPRLPEKRSNKED